MTDRETLVTATRDTSVRSEPDTNRIEALCATGTAQSQGTRDRGLYHRAKRGFDVIVAASLLLLLTPLMLAIALLIKVTTPGPAILTQERVGKGGRVFPFLKFRSMYDNPDRSADITFARAYINGEQPTTAKRDGVFKPANDRRITPVGRWLRKTSMDELPQLINILRGDMSLVGPRPSMPYEVEVYKPWHFRRLQVLPGLTGLAQISGRSSLVFEDIVKIDVDYIERCSLLLDLSILLRTLPVVLSGNGAR
jgi:lipopolysaccharide/colanic/teichoic acid biosynthesis glycosyltransferase